MNQTDSIVGKVFDVLVVLRDDSEALGVVNVSDQAVEQNLKRRQVFVLELDLSDANVIKLS